MQLIYKDKSINIIYANSFFKKLKGLLGKKEIDYGMFFQRTNSIHTFGMKTNIDVIAMNNKKEVIFKAVNIQKNRIIKVNNSIFDTNIIELPPFWSKSIKIGDKLSFIRK